MCGRFAFTLPSDAMARLFRAVPSNDLPETPNFNICPTNQVHVVLNPGEGRVLRGLRWGFVPHWYKTPGDGPLLINARSETLAEKPAFRMASRDRRCLILASGFYEWTKDEAGNRLPWYIRRTDGAPIAFAGVWQSWDRADAPLTTCAIVTMAAEGDMRDIHHRMPLVLDEPDWALWLGEAGKGAARLMRFPKADRLEFYRVDTAVNSNRAHGPELIEPFED